MSGGSWDYVFSRFDGVANRLAKESDPLRRLLGRRVELISKALHDIEWVDSDDYGSGDDVAAIKAVLSADLAADVRDEINAVAARTTAEIEVLRSFAVTDYDN
jgi:hypothetical protein